MAARTRQRRTVQPWTRSEVEATVSDYFDMLEMEVRGVPYNKAEHRRRLLPHLNDRSERAVEDKHQNISAVLHDLGFIPCIRGYKPLGNYQRLLYDVVAERLAARPALSAAVREQIAEPVALPTVDDILAAMVKAPKREPDGSAYRARAARDRLQPRRDVDYLSLEAANRSLGAAGEEFVVRYEQARLTRSGHERLAAKVEHVARTRGDGLGYDVLSFEVSGQERLIEVKTTKYGPLTPFVITRNEVSVSQTESERYYLYRAFDFRRRPRLFYEQGPIEHSFDLAPSQFTASIR